MVVEFPWLNFTLTGCGGFVKIGVLFCDHVSRFGPKIYMLDQPFSAYAEFYTFFFGKVQNFIHGSRFLLFIV